MTQKGLCHGGAAYRALPAQDKEKALMSVLPWNGKTVEKQAQGYGNEENWDGLFCPMEIGKPFAFRELLDDIAQYGARHLLVMLHQKVFFRIIAEVVFFN